jgi:phosphatidylserine/phosphatidylglycerophosphate/cardiolipin synthase-like enzyme
MHALLLALTLFADIGQPPANNVAVEAICFSPHGHCTNRLVEALNGAQKTIRVQAYSFTSLPIARALVAAQRRGVDVQIIVDRDSVNAVHGQAVVMRRAGSVVMVDRAHAIAHNKVMIIDDRLVVTGSFNFTNAAETKNAENLIILRSNSVAKQFSDNWGYHREHSVPFEEDVSPRPRARGGARLRR